MSASAERCAYCGQPCVGNYYNVETWKGDRHVSSVVDRSPLCSPGCLIAFGHRLVPRASVASVGSTQGGAEENQ